MIKTQLPYPRSAPKASAKQPLIHLDNVTLRVRDRKILPRTQWRIKHNQNWAVIGENGAGKSTLVRTLVGLAPVVAGWIYRHGPKARPDSIGYAAFENEHRFVARDIAKDEAREFSGSLEGGVRVGKALRIDGATHREIADACETMSLTHLLERQVRHLSGGEMRRLFIARAFLQSRKLVILDEPFEGLDTKHRRRLVERLEAAMGNGIQLVLVTHRIENIPPAVTHVIGLKDGRVVMQGKRQEVLSTVSRRKIYRLPPPIPFPTLADVTRINRHGSIDEIIRLEGVNVQFGGHQVFKNFTWRVKKGENWAVTGPNGVGKSTLMGLIAGDQLQAYANKIHLFGRRRGSGESIWEIKTHIGLVSAEFHRRYRRNVTVRDTVASGFFDSVGLYRRCTPAQRKRTDKWVEYIGMHQLRERPLATLSYGQQRLVLIARAMVKTPALLILDEPCQGLDPSQRSRVIALIDAIGRQPDTELIYVTHYPDEIPGCITHHLELALASRPVIRSAGRPVD